MPQTEVEDGIGVTERKKELRSLEVLTYFLFLSPNPYIAW